MNTKNILLLVLISILHIQGQNSFANNANPFFYFKQISIADGLPSSVTSIYDDNNGFLWIGTSDGLFRFDGEKLKRYNIDKSDLSKHEYIHSVKGNFNNNVFVISSKGCSSYNPDNDTFELCTYKGKRLQPYSITFHNNIFIISVKGELLFLNNKKGIEGKLELSDDKGFIKIEDYDEQNYICLASNKKLYLVNKKSGRISKSTICNNENVYNFFRDSNNSFWISNYAKGIAHYSKKGELIYQYTTKNSQLSNDMVLDISERNKQIWLATDGGGVNIINPDNNTINIFSNRYEHNFPANSVACLCNGVSNMWIGLVREGLLGANENFITSYTRVSSDYKIELSEKCTISLLEDKNGKLWIGTDGGGLNCYNPAKDEFTHFNSTKDDKIISICSYSENKLLVSLFSKGFYVFNTITGKYENEIKIDRALKDRLVYSGIPYNIYCHENGEIMTYSNLIYKLDRSTNSFKLIKKVKEMNETSSWIYLGEANNSLYFKNNKSVIVYSKKRNDVLNVYSENDKIFAACIGDKGDFWISTNTGIKHFDEKHNKKEVIHLPDESLNATSLTIDKKNILWIGTLGSLYAYSQDSHEFTVFGESDGVIPNDFLPKPVLVSKSNNIFLGGTRGLIRILANSFDVKNNSDRKGMICLLEVLLNGKKVMPNSDEEYNWLKVPHDFTSLSIYTFARKTDIFKKRIYRYYIKGLNDDYIQSSKSHFTIQNLRPGTYDILVEYMQANGKWSRKFSLLRLNVLYPWYMNGWFILACLIFCATIIIVAIRYHETIIKRNILDKERLIYKEKVKKLININYELRTPLTLIYSPLKQLLNSRQLPLSLKAKIRRVFKQSIQMRDIINMILNMRRMEMGQDIMNIQPVQFDKWILSLVDDFKTELEEKNITLDIELDKEISVIALDALQCEIVINNLIMASYKYSKTESKIILSCKLNDNKKYVVISVANSSYSLNKDELESLFERFNINKRKTDNGIGLSYARLIAEMHNGFVEADSNCKDGTTLFFTLPVNINNSNTETPIKEYINEILPGYERDVESKSVEYPMYESVIIVENNYDLRNYLIENMKDVFRNVYSANNGKEAYLMILSNTPQMVISDSDMPKMNGYELCAKIKSNANLNYIPIVLITNTISVVEQKEHLKLGVDAYFSKPFDIDILKTRIQNILYNYNIVKKHYSSTDSTSLSIRNGADDDKKKELVIKLDKIIEENISDPNLSVEKIAFIMGMSRASLYSKLKDIIPNGINDYIIDKKINIACILLSNNENSISDIAEKLGFTQSRNFSTLFKNKMNITPSEYRKKNSTQ